jgi:hypothetical protein
VIVPKEPTKEMLWAADRALFQGNQDDPDKPDFVLFGQTRAEWAAMIAAATHKENKL